MSDSEMIEKYKQIDYILHLDYGWLWQDILRTIGSGIVFSLMWVNDMVENIVDKSISLNDFYASGPIKEFMDMSRPIVWGLFLIALIVLGFQFMLNKIDKRNEVVLNIILAVCVIVVIPDLMVNMGKLTNAGIDYIKPEKSSLSGQMVKSNVADVLYYAENDFSVSDSSAAGVLPRPPSKSDSKVGTTDFTHGNRLTEESLVYLPFTQKLDFFEDEGWFNWTSEEWVRELSDSSKAMLKHRMVAKGVGNEFYVEELDKNMIKMTKIGRQTYYRYHVNWGVLIFSLLVTTVALVITVIKVGRSVFDLAFHQGFGMFIAATDLTGGQRTKKILVEIMNTFAVIFLMVFLLKLFILYSSWVYGLKDNIGSIGVLLLLIAGAWALIDAPDIVQRMLGIDAGLRNGWQAMAGSYAAMRATGMVTKSVGKGLTGIGKGVGKTVGASASLGGKAREAIDKIGKKSSAGDMPRELVKPMPDSGSPDDDPPTSPGSGSNSNNDLSNAPSRNSIPSESQSQSEIPSNNGEGSSLSSGSSINEDKLLSRASQQVNSGIPPIPSRSSAELNGSDNSGRQSVLPTLNNVSGYQSAPPTPSNVSGRQSVLPTLNNVSGYQSAPPTPSNISGHQSAPPMPNNVPGHQSVAPTSNNVPGRQSAPPTSNNVPGRQSAPPMPNNVPSHQSVAPTSNNISGHQSAPPMPNNVPGHQSAPSTPSNVSGRQSAPSTPSNVSGRQSVPPTPNNVSGYQSAPSTPSNVSGRQSAPSTPSNVSGRQSAPQAPNNASGYQSAPTTPNNVSGPRGINDNQSRLEEEKPIRKNKKDSK